MFDAYPKPVKSKLLALRRLILDTAKTTKGVGAIEEALKWGQPSYLTRKARAAARSGSIRSSPCPDQYAVYFHCQTNLVETFRELYPELNYGGNRAILLDAEDKLPEAELRHCVALALTYHLGKRKNGDSVTSLRAKRSNPRCFMPRIGEWWVTGFALRHPDASQ